MTHPPVTIKRIAVPNHLWTPLVAILEQIQDTMLDDRQRLVLQAGSITIVTDPFIATCDSPELVTIRYNGIPLSVPFADIPAIIAALRQETYHVA